MTREKPILFSAPMVRAILSGAKTQTRSVVKGLHQHSELTAPMWAAADEAVFIDGSNPVRGETVLARCSYGAPDDRLWVRESFRLSAWSTEVHYPASLSDYDVREKGPWKPSIHMPRWASRITLDVLSVRVERLQAITEADAIAEGVTHGEDQEGFDHRDLFMHLWQKINGKKHPWESNPWVWVVTFKRAAAGVEIAK